MVRYRERAKRKVWWVLLGTCAAAWLVLWWTADRSWVFASVMVGIFGGIAALTLLSTDVYGAVTLTDDELRVGRDRVPLSDIVPASVAGPGEGGSPPGTLLGGAYAPALGQGLVRFVRHDGRAAGVASRDPEALTRALRSVLGSSAR